MTTATTISPEREDAHAPILVAKDLSLAYDKRAPSVVSNVNLEILTGEKVAIVGESGSGKSTLAKALVGIMRPVRGTMDIHGRPWSSVRRRESERRAVQMIFQDPYSALNPTMTPLATVSEAFRVVRGQSKSEAQESAMVALSDVGLGGKTILRLPKGLSGGQLQRVAIARSLACQPEVVVADEATASLDVSVQAQIVDLLVDLVRVRKMALVMISHDLHLTRSVADRVIVMRNGQIVEAGTVVEIFESPVEEYTRELLSAAALDGIVRSS